MHARLLSLKLSLQSLGVHIEGGQQQTLKIGRDIFQVRAIDEHEEEIFG